MYNPNHRFKNTYNDPIRAISYSELEFPGTYYLAFRDIPAIIKKHINGTHLLDFGCGAGRSTRFLKTIGYNTIGVDISEAMIDAAYKKDPNGHYQQVPNGDLSCLTEAQFDMVFSAFTFDNIPGYDLKVKLFKEFNRLIKPTGIVINLVSSPELYVNEWASFSTKDFPGNKTAKCGDRVYTIMKDVEDKRPVEDIYWPEEDYMNVYQQSGFDSIENYKPLFAFDDHYIPINENRIAPWRIDVINKRN